MFEESARRLTGISGVATGVLAIVVAPLYFIYDGPPPSWNVLTRTLLSVVMLAVLVVFFSGLRQVFSTAAGLVSIGYSAGVTYVAVTLVSASMEAGVPLDSPDGALDPTVDGPLAAGMVLIHGPVARILSIVILVSFGLAASRTAEFPKWISTSAYIIAAANLVFIPSLYFGMNAANFYASNGWGSTATISSVLLYWTAAVGIALLRRQAPTPAVDERASAATA
jgi:type IV secretory pathway VirB2 component (pilin)